MTEEASMSVAERIAALKKAPPNNGNGTAPHQRGKPGKLKLPNMVIPVGPPPTVSSFRPKNTSSLRISALSSRLKGIEPFGSSGGSSSGHITTTTTTSSNHANFDRPIVLPGRRRPATPQSISNIQFSTELGT